MEGDKLNKVKVGIIGCGNISDIYLQNCIQVFDILEVVACADIILERAEEKAQQYKIPKACSVEELLSNPEIELVINLTIPKAHTEVCLSVLNAGKSVYVEKPLAITREDGKKILETAKKNKLLVGGAPDTFLGAGIQTCRKIIDDGLIGYPIAATSFMVNHGHESWHPDPEFYYKEGGGPMFDMGPYYLTALITLMGPVFRVTGSTRVTFPERLITSEPKKGNRIEVEVPTHIAGIMDFHNGAVGTILTSFDIWGSQLPRIEVYGSAGSLVVPDPNTFGGPVLMQKSSEKNWIEMPLSHGYAKNSRGLGVADMARAIRNGTKHRANGEMQYHVLDIMHGFHDASREGSHIILESTCEQPSPLPILDSIEM